jgi:hypothetical protein
MKIAIHERKGSFSDRWIEYCKKHEICHRIVNCYDSDIIDQLKDCDGLMWHWSVAYGLSRTRLCSAVDI